jgi:hypothetical protein
MACTGLGWALSSGVSQNSHGVGASWRSGGVMMKVCLSQQGYPIQPGLNRDNPSMQIQFTKMQGAGNDFVVLDETQAPLNLSAAQYR